MILPRITRVTKYLPRFADCGLGLQLYKRILTPGILYRIEDFDGDLVFDIDPRETMGFGLWHVPQRYEKSERERFCSAISPGCSVLDVGANLGIYTLLAAKRGANVFAIEADPANAKMLRHHIQLNGFAHGATVFEMAASASPGRVSLRRNPFNSGGSAVIPGDEVAAGTIDSLNLPPIDVCKMDIEGSEERAIAGMVETLRRSPQLRLLIECSALSNQESLLKSLRSHFSNIRNISGDNLWCSN